MNYFAAGEDTESLPIIYLECVIMKKAMPAAITLDIIKRKL